MIKWNEDKTQVTISIQFPPFKVPGNVLQFDEEHTDEYKLQEVEAALDGGYIADLYWEHPETKTLYCAQCLYEKGKGHDPDLHY